MKTIPLLHSGAVTIALLSLSACGGQPVGAETAAPAQEKSAAKPPAQPAANPTPSPPPVEEDPGHYTRLGSPDCKVTKVDEEAGGSTSLCPGLGGYRLAVIDSDARMSIDVIAPDGNAQPLNLWSVAGGAFSSLGPRAEWRFPQGSNTPSALIVRFESYEYPEQPERTRSYLVVAKLAASGSCVIALVKPGPDQNRRAREVADGAASAACKPAT